MSEPEKVTNADRVYVYRDSFHYLLVSENKPGTHIAWVEFIRAPTNETGNARMGGE